MEKATRGSWVEIEIVVLEPGKRAPQVPEDTQRTPLMQWVNGYLVNEEAKIGDEVEIETLIGRRIKGKLSNTNPQHIHNFGRPVKELLDVGVELRNELKELL